MTVWADVEWATFSIVTEIVTLKAFSEGGSGMLMDGDLDNPSRGGKDSCPIGKGLKKGPVGSEDLLIDSPIL